LDEQQEDLFLKALSNFLIKGDKLYFEFRTDKDKDKDKVYNNHFRRFVNLYDTITKLNDYGFNIEYSIESNGLAKFKEEDPIVGRIIAIKS
jgi:tellurite methyltransferase